MIKFHSCGKQELLNTAYDKAVQEIENHEDCVISISVQNCRWYHIIAHLITLGALLKGREDKSNHTALIDTYGETPTVAEALKDGIKITCLKERFFNGDFKGKVLFQYIHCNMTESDRQKIAKATKKRQDSGDKYDVSTAFKAWYDWDFRIFGFHIFNLTQNQRDRSYKLFCTDFMIDILKLICINIIENVALKSRLELINPAEIEPSEWVEFLDRHNIERYLALNTRKLK